MATYQDSRYNIALPSGSGGALVLIKTLTASSSGTLSFVNGSSDVVLDNTYRTYMFKYLDIHPATDNVKFNVNFRDGDSNYDATKTTSAFSNMLIITKEIAIQHYLMNAGGDLAQSTSAHSLVLSMGNGADECCSGEMFLFNPSSTTFVKHFISRTASYSYQNYAYDGTQQVTVM
jgi:hypothetical protein